MRALTSYLRHLAQRLGVAVLRPETMASLIADRQALQRMQGFHAFVAHLTPEAQSQALRLFAASRGENFQDIFAQLVLGHKTAGYFVEFGATDGVTGSNTYMLETEDGWQGLLSEPARGWHAALAQNRTAAILHKCVWRESGQMMPFREAPMGEFSTLDAYAETDSHAKRRTQGTVYEVETLSLNDWLEQAAAPRRIDLLSVDTEGSELEILSAVDFAKWQFSVVVVEHNYRPDRAQIADLMAAQGYLRAPAAISKYDDWYVAADLAPALSRVFGAS